MASNDRQASEQIRVNINGVTYVCRGNNIERVGK